MPTGVRRLVVVAAAGVCACALAVMTAGAVRGGGAAAGAEALSPPSQPVPRALFSLNVVDLEYGAGWPTMPFFGWRTGDSSWWRLEALPGQWQWARLDQDVALAERHGVELLLILDSTPTWASSRPAEAGCCGSHATPGKNAPAANLEDWRTYVRTVATRYKGRVHAYELWNEPNEDEFTGTIDQLVALDRVAYQTLKQVDPAVTVVAPALTWHGGTGPQYLDRYLALGGGRYADALAFHFYVAPRPPEAMLPRIQAVRAVMAAHGLSGMPLWNTETGWNILNHDRNPAPEEFAGAPLTDAQGAAYVARSYILSWAAGVARLYWYNWGGQSMGLNEYDEKTPKLSATAFAVAQRWLVGAVVSSCAPDAQGTWVCPLVRGGGPAWVVWNPGRTVGFAPPKPWNVRRAETVTGAMGQVAPDAPVAIGPSPVLLEASPRNATSEGPGSPSVRIGSANAWGGLEGAAP